MEPQHQERYFREPGLERTHAIGANDNWVELLTLAEFSYKNTVSSTTGVTSFFAIYGQAPRWQILARQDVPLATNEKLLDFSDQLQKLKTHLRAEMKYVQDEQADGLETLFLLGNRIGTSTTPPVSFATSTCNINRSRAPRSFL
ncbi:hypothetical protein EX30DRAFT_375803 [Ascodesmis nigricans]|uniref:Uncharacterized protein n=1 Tax=Ascodesmis nigricans TaxID=341454 RepID=A0A4S2MHB5_9PEZI|nr:hypothetical protein EX30DRAFT_375803 [Ascodesmis nigricans]